MASFAFVLEIILKILHKSSCLSQLCSVILAFVYVFVLFIHCFGASCKNIIFLSFVTVILIFKMIGDHLVGGSSCLLGRQNRC